MANNTSSRRFWGTVSGSFYFLVEDRLQIPGWVIFQKDTLVLKALAVGKLKTVAYTDISSGKFIYNVLCLFDGNNKIVGKIKSPSMKSIITELQKKGIVIDSNGIGRSIFTYWLSRIVLVIAFLAILAAVVSSFR